MEMSYKQALRNSMERLEQKPVLTIQERQELSELKDRWDANQDYLNEGGMAYDG
uniref:Uncharacterized protein n=1 Tax=viral metagenome TaxID=1070528 RepID=A0A6M3JQQ8_9ZZZZ